MRKRIPAYTGYDDDRTRRLARTALAADKRHGWRLLANPGRLRIQTIDALNLGLARRLPVLSGLGHGLGVEEHADDLYRLAATRLIAHLPDCEPAHGRAIGLVLAHLDNRASGFLDLLVEILRSREAWLPVLPGVGDTASDAALRSRLEAARTALVQGHLASLRRAFPVDALREAASLARMAGAELRLTGSSSPIAGWSDAAALPDDGIASLPLWRGLAELLLTVEGHVAPDGQLQAGFQARSGRAGCQTTSTGAVCGAAGSCRARGTAGSGEAAPRARLRR